MTEDEEFEDDKGENELWSYTAWELLRASIKVFLWDTWQFLKPRNLYRRLHPLSDAEITRLKQECINQIKIKAAKELGGEPSDYDVRELENRDIRDML